jgi:hypothetical protein
MLTAATAKRTAAFRWLLNPVLARRAAGCTKPPFGSKTGEYAEGAEKVKRKQDEFI